MKFAAKGLAALVGGALLMGMLTAAPVSAGDLKKCTLVSDLDKLGKRLDKELFGWMKR